MKPYGREKNLKGSGPWKRDYHVRKAGRKIANWWEDMCDVVSRMTMKRMTEREVDEEVLSETKDDTPQNQNPELGIR